LGLRHSAVLITARIPADLETSNIDAILLHELGHVARRDCAWQLLQRIIEAVLWFHPLMWLAGRRITFIRERSCDEFAVHGLGNSQPYIETLLSMAASLTRQPTLALGLTMLRCGALDLRVATSFLSSYPTGMNSSPWPSLRRRQASSLRSVRFSGICVKRCAHCASRDREFG
jgi:Zn-dependent protease with chaperone function